MESKDTYDGTLVVVVKGEIARKLMRPREGKASIYDPKLRTFAPIGFNLPAVLEVADEEGISFPNVVRELHYLHPIDDLRAAQRRSEIIENGKLQMAVLLNTIGGIIEVQNQVFAVMHYIRKRGGFVATFGRKRVESAGANIFMRGNRGKRFLALRTDMMFHLPTGDYQQEGEDDGVVNRRGEREWRGLSGRLTRWTVPRHRKEMSRLLRAAEEKTAKKPDRPVELNASRAEKFGFAEVRDSLREQFEAVLGIDEYRRGSAVDRFFR